MREPADRMEYWHQVDLYSLGIVLYQLMVGRIGGFSTAKRQQLFWDAVGNKDELKHASRGTDDMDFTTVNAAITGDPRLPALEKVVNTACRLNLQKRYQSAEEMKAVLERILNPGMNAAARQKLLE